MENLENDVLFENANQKSAEGYPLELGGMAFPSQNEYQINN